MTYSKNPNFHTSLSLTFFSIQVGPLIMILKTSIVIQKNHKLVPIRNVIPIFESHAQCLWALSLYHFPRRCHIHRSLLELFSFNWFHFCSGYSSAFIIYKGKFVKKDMEVSTISFRLLPQKCYKRRRTWNE